MQASTCVSCKKTDLISSITDIIICICCQGDEERFASVQKEFHKMQLCAYVHFYRPPRHANPRKGSFLSHQIIPTLATGHDIAWVTEDDVRFFSNSLLHFQTLAESVSLMPRKWDLLYLGQLTFAAVPVLQSLGHVWRSIATFQHSYIINLRNRWATKTLPNLRFANRFMDSYPWCLSQQFTFFPSLCYQAPTPTNYSKMPRMIDKVSRVLANHSNIVIPVMDHLAYFVIPLLLIWWLIHCLGRKCTRPRK